MSGSGKGKEEGKENTQIKAEEWGKGEVRKEIGGHLFLQVRVDIMPT